MTSGREGSSALRLLAERSQLDLFGRGTVEVSRYEELWRWFRRVFAENHYKPKTKILHETSAKHLLPFFGILPLRAISPQLIEEYIAQRKRFVKPRTVNIEVTCLRCHLRVAERYGWLEKVPRIELLREGPPRCRYLTREELAAILHESPPWLREVVTFAVATGMRRDEIRLLTWEQVKLAEQIVILTETKTGQMRSVPLNETALSVLGSRPRRINCPFVFWNPDTGTAWASVTQMFVKNARRAGINVRFHDLRHTCASWLVQSGVEIQVVKEILGHKDLRMTLRYAHLAPRAKLDGASRLDKMLLPPLDRHTLQA